LVRRDMHSEIAGNRLTFQLGPERPGFTVN
jgi:hypothetical protein